MKLFDDVTGPSACTGERAADDLIEQSQLPSSAGKNHYSHRRRRQPMSKRSTLTHCRAIDVRSKWTGKTFLLARSRVMCDCRSVVGRSMDLFFIIFHEKYL